MKRKTMSKKGALVLSVVWTVITILWAVTAFLRTFDGAGEIDVLTIITLLVCAVACVSHWYRYANHSE